MLFFLFSFLNSYFVVGQEVPVLTEAEQKRVDTILAWAKRKENQGFLDSDFLTSDKHLEKFLRYPTTKRKAKSTSAKKKVVMDKGERKVVMDKGKGKVSDSSPHVPGKIFEAETPKEAKEKLLSSAIKAFKHTTIGSSLLREKPSEVFDPQVEIIENPCRGGSTYEETQGSRH